MKHLEEAQTIVKSVGGEKNINGLVHCATRLRFSLADDSQVDKSTIESLPDVLSVVNSGGQFQVVIGSKVPDYFAAIKSITKINGESTSPKKGRFSFNMVFEIISGAFSPLIPAMAGSGMIKAILTILVQVGWLSDASSSYAVMSAASNAIFYFLPVFLGITLTSKIGGNMYVGGVIGAALLEPSFTGLIGQENLDFLGISLKAVDYATTIFPIFVAIFIYYFVDRFLKKLIFKDIQLFAVPMFSLMLMVPLTILIFGPFGTVVGDGLSQGVTWLIEKSSLLSGIVLGGGMPFMVMFGLHWGFSPITIDNLANLGGDPIEGMAVAAVFAQIGIAIGFYLRSKKHSKMRALTGPLALTGLFAGVTEPIVYGLILRYKRLLPIVAISGAIGGAICGVTGVTMNAYVFHNIFSIPVYTPKLGYFLGVGSSLIVGAVLSYFFGVKKEEESEFLPETGLESDSFANVSPLQVSDETLILAPVSGQVLPLAEVDDQVFASGAAGQGVAIMPTDNQVVAPFDGEIVAVFPSKHAIGIKATNGCEILIHIGLNTVMLEGDGFDVHVTQGQFVGAGELLITFNKALIEAEGYSLVTPIITTNLPENTTVVPLTMDSIKSGEALFTITAN
ncbi:PTS glucose transporter subunit IIA [Vagococcus sp. BWB3-3]|uniref:PTS system sucrose-specific EIIBCA component n=1 Tax=Vagococcus allomyrinae TaxID=2794353 RepID=A0A940PB00_9ENTE|nr:glucose PTS transporter subunit IIA [Vagococcus allomyrinae]MBP1040713.1 PTS glucose transporter subunit IIA [Vagococcus allomyrinae]